MTFTRTTATTRQGATTARLRAEVESGMMARESRAVGAPSVDELLFKQRVLNALPDLAGLSAAQAAILEALKGGAIHDTRGLDRVTLESLIAAGKVDRVPGGVQVNPEIRGCIAELEK